MAHAEDLDAVYERFQKNLDEFQAMDGEHYESNIRKQLKIAALERLVDLELAKLSGGEFKLVQIIKQMLVQPGLLIMDEPDVFLDFHNLNGLRDLINSYQGTMLVVTHNRYLLNHCFDKILHLENADVQEFDGDYTDYNLALLQKKIQLQELAVRDTEEIARTKKMVERLRKEATMIDNASKGRALKAKASQLARLEARRIKEPFVNIRQPEITLPVNVDANAQTQEGECLLRVENYSLVYDDVLLDAVSFAVHAGEKVALVGPNGTGKTTLLREIYEKTNPAVWVSEKADIGFLSQIHGETLNEENNAYQELEPLGYETKAQVEAYLAGYCFKEDELCSKIAVLSGGEKNLLQLAKLAAGNANLLLLDEPTSHLDTYAQRALEEAVREYQGAVLMVSHDFYSIANCMDYVLFVEDKTVRRMRIRSFRKMIYENHFHKEYLELEQQKLQLEIRIEACLRAADCERAKAMSGELEAVVEKMKRCGK